MINATLIASACLRTELQSNGVGLLEQYLLMQSVTANDDRTSNDVDDDDDGSRPKRARVDVRQMKRYDQPTFIQLAR